MVKSDAWKGLSANAVVKAGNLGEKVPAGADKHPVWAYGGLLGLQHRFVNAGAGYFARSEGEGDAKVKGNIVTVYSSGHWKATEGMSVHVIVRSDIYEPDKDTSNDERKLYIVGVGLKFFDDTLALVPNYQKESYKV